MVRGFWPAVVAPVIVFFACTVSCGETSTTNDAGIAAQDARPNADASVDRPESGTFDDAEVEGPDSGLIGAIIGVRRAGQPVGARLDLGEADQGSTGTPVELEIANTGDTPFELAPIELLGGQNDAFVIVQPASSTIEASSSVTFTIALAPPSTGEFLSRVEVRSSIGATRVATFEVFGRGRQVIVPVRPLFVAVGMSQRRVISEDGVTWTNSQSENQPAGDNDYQFRGACYGAGTWVGVGGSAVGRIAWTRDGVNWTDVSDNNSFLGGCAYGNGYFVAVGSSGRHIRSVDGNVWTDPARHRIANFRGITFGDGRFVAVGDGGRRDVTLDGMTFTDTSSGGDQLFGVAYGNGLFVAAGGNGRRIISADGGQTWTNDQSGGSNLRGIAFGNGVFVAVGQNRALVSPDGINWTEHTVGQTAFSGITFGDGKFLGLGYMNRRVTSTDGMTWSSAVTDNDPILIGAAWGPGEE